MGSLSDAAALIVCIRRRGPQVLANVILRSACRTVAVSPSMSVNVPVLEEPLAHCQDSRIRSRQDR